MCEHCWLSEDDIKITWLVAGGSEIPHKMLRTRIWSVWKALVAFDQANHFFGVATGATLALPGRGRGFTLAFALAFALGSAVAALGRKGLQGSPMAYH
jgi:hypothetical protein